MTPVDILLLCLPVSTLGILVLSSGRDLATHQPTGAGAELLHSSLAGQDTLTICARFITYQFTNYGYDDSYHTLIQQGKMNFFESNHFTEEYAGMKRYAGAKWKNGNILIYSPDHFVEVDWIWKPGEWNSACIILSASRAGFVLVRIKLIFIKNFFGYSQSACSKSILPKEHFLYYLQWKNSFDK